MPNVFLIPTGTKNLQFNFNEIKDYYVEVLDSDNAVVATTPIMQVENCNEVRLHFINYLGGFDAVNFPKPKVIHEASGSEFKKSDLGSERFNVNSNDTYEVKRLSREDEMEWLQECIDSPKVYLESEKGYIPVVMLNGKFEKLKNAEEYKYEFVLQFKLSQEFKILRN